MNRVGIALLVLALAPAAARASQQGVVVTKNWKVMDKCAQQAQAAFPDFTAESNARREALEKACLEWGNLPPRQPVAPGR